MRHLETADDPDRSTLLWWVSAPRRPERVVLVLHGRADDRQQGPPRWTSPVVLRMVPFAFSLRHGGGRTAVAFLRYGGRGWEAGRRVEEGRWALQRIAARYPGVPVGLLGHSMGGRVALLLAGERGVDRVATLAAWAEQADLPHWKARPGLQMLLVHGLADRITSPDGSRVAEREFARLGAQTTLVLEPGEGHALLSQPREWHRRVTRWFSGLS